MEAVGTRQHHHIDRLLWDKLPLAGIACVLKLSESWLQGAVNHCDKVVVPRQVPMTPQRRMLVTYDRKTMPAEFGQFITSKTSSGVLILFQSLSISEAIDAIILVWEASAAEEWINQIMAFPF